MPNIGDQAPDFSGQDVITGLPFNLSDYLGKVVLVSFSGLTWCGPCQFEAPIIQDLWDDLKDCLNKEVQFVMISVGDSEQGLITQIQNMGIDIPFLINPSIQQAYDVSAVPTLFILNKQHKICKIKVGAGGDPQVLKNEIHAMLKECGMGECKGDLKGLGKFVAVAQILFGVTSDGGGLVISGGKPIPIDPWGPYWSLNRDTKDLLYSLAVKELSSSLRDRESKMEIEIAALKSMSKSVKRLEQRFGNKNFKLDRTFSPLK